jgi:anti-sigma B factor antagonist
LEARLMATPLEVSVGRDSDDVPVVVAVGEIDMSNALRFREALGVASAEAEGAEGGAAVGGIAAGGAGGDGAGGVFVVDLSGVEYLDSAGINALYQHVSRVRLIAAPLLVPVLTVAGLAEVTSVREPSELVERLGRRLCRVEALSGLAGGFAGRWRRLDGRALHGRGQFWSLFGHFCPRSW